MSSLEWMEIISLFQFRWMWAQTKRVAQTKVKYSTKQKHLYSCDDIFPLHLLAFGQQQITICERYMHSKNKTKNN